MTLTILERRGQTPLAVRRIGIGFVATMLALISGCAAQPRLEGQYYDATANLGQCAGGQTMVCSAVSLGMLLDPPPGACKCQTLRIYSKPTGRRQIKRRGAPQ